MRALILAALLAAGPALAEPAKPPAPTPKSAKPAPLNQQPGFQLVSVHVGGKGPGHLARKQGSGGGVAPATCDGSLDLSTGCSNAVLVVF